MIKMEEKFHVPGPTNSNTETETSITEEQLEQDEGTECQTPATDETTTSDFEKDTEDLKDNTSTGRNDNNTAQNAATEPSQQDSKECEINPEKESVSQQLSRQENPIETSAYIDIEKAIRKQTGYIGRHWRGELPLATSFWINVFLVDFILKSAEVISAAFLHNPSTGTHVTIIYNPFIIMILYPWQIMGLWRSCDRHIYTTGKRFWARTAQVIIVIGFIATLSHLVVSWPLYNL